MRPDDKPRANDLPVALSDDDRADLKEVKVRLPVDQVLRLHYTRMKRRQNFSEIVSTALTRYFDDLQRP